MDDAKHFFSMMSKNGINISDKWDIVELYAKTEANHMKEKILLHGEIALHKQMAEQARVQAAYKTLGKQEGGTV